MIGPFGKQFGPHHIWMNWHHWTETRSSAGPSGGTQTTSKVKNLTRYADPSADAFETLRLAGKALGLPPSLLIDKDGCEVGVVAGPANWDKPDAVAAVAALKGG